MLQEYNNIIAKGKQQHNELVKFIRFLKKKKPSDLDQVVHQLHLEAFSKIDCLKCANCCSTTSPGIRDIDIQRISKTIKKKPADFTQEYLDIDTDGLYMFRAAPCPFLMDNNYCSIYKSRPGACSDYPMTDRPRFYQMLTLCEKNLLICPAVVIIITELKRLYQ